MSPFCRATDIPVFGLLVMSPLGFKARFTSGATSTDLLVASMAAETFLIHLLALKFITAIGYCSKVCSMRILFSYCASEVKFNCAL